ncbi:MAG: flagellar motor switch protein FliN [Candidatus Krumholzibacteria bacterium]|nr:flagellar motor switch protein FliN [Candidatus Krumholzibacteria bacterium]
MNTDDTYLNNQEPDETAGVTSDGSFSTGTAVLEDESSSLIGDLKDDVSDTANLDLLLDVNLQVTVELGRAGLKFREVLNLAPGSVVELDRQTSEPVDILVNGSLLATGEVVVVDDHFAVRITKLLNRVERLKKVL